MVRTHNWCEEMKDKKKRDIVADLEEFFTQATVSKDPIALVWVPDQF